MNKNWGQNFNSKPKKSPKRLKKPPLVDNWAEEKDEESELVTFKDEKIFSKMLIYNSSFKKNLCDQIKSNQIKQFISQHEQWLTSRSEMFCRGGL